MSLGVVLGAVLTLGLITVTGIISGEHVKNAADFTGGAARSGSVIVAGTIIGTLVGGSSTVGTAQLAYSYGLSAWWYTLGSGIACFIMAVFFVRPMRRTGCATLLEMIGREYGQTARTLSSVLNAIGTFINIIAQLLSGSAVAAILFPGIPVTAAAAVVALLMLCYVVFGGVWGTGLVGSVKTCLLYLAVIVSGVLAYRLTGGISVLRLTFDASQYFNLFARGFGTDAGAGLSLMLGVLCTQTYAQATLAGRSDRVAVRGTLCSALLTPPVGIGGILVGLYMRKIDGAALEAGTLTLASAAKTAFPRFVMQSLPPFAAGIVLATLLVAVLGTGAGLALGISTIMHRDVVSLLTDRYQDPKKGLRFSRVCIIVILFCAVMFTLLPGDMILNFSFLSMGLRAAVVFAPLLGALFLPGRIDHRFALAAIICGPAVVFAGRMMGLPFDPLFLGIAAALLAMLIGFRRPVRNP